MDKGERERFDGILQFDLLKGKVKFEDQIESKNMRIFASICLKSFVLLR